MNTLKKSLIGLSLFVLLASCSAGTTAKSPTAEKSTTAEKTTTSDKATPDEMRKNGQMVTTPSEQTDRELTSVVEVELLNGKVKLSQPQAGSGDLDFNIRNETAEPLSVAIVKTSLEPSKLAVKDGRIEANQSDVEVMSESSRLIDGGRQGTMTKILEPGDYQVVVTSPSKAMPVAHAVLTLKPL